MDIFKETISVLISDLSFGCSQKLKEKGGSEVAKAILTNGGRDLFLIGQA